MWIALALTVGFISLFAVTIKLAKAEGSKEAQLNALKNEVQKVYEEQRKANKIFDDVRNMSADNVRSRLQNCSRK